MKMAKNREILFIAAFAQASTASLAEAATPMTMLTITDKRLGAAQQAPLDI